MDTLLKMRLSLARLYPPGSHPVVLEGTLEK